jgi:tRNA-specific 2-thiouridylase
LDAEYIATGHYARIEFDDQRQRYLLKKGRDPRKDQSYFLYIMNQKQLQRTLMPLGGMTKDRVRQIAKEKDLPVANKPESQEICFIPNNNYREFLKEHIPDAIKPGAIIDKAGNVIGEHQGIPFYTIGQRRGLGIAAGKPLYVTAIDLDRNIIVAGKKEEVYGDELVASELNWITRERLQSPIEVKARIRYLHKEAEAIVISLNNDKVRVKFREPQTAITPGQAVVFYDDDTLIGGGTIERVGR